MADNLSTADATDTSVADEESVDAGADAEAALAESEVSFDDSDSADDDSDSEAATDKPESETESEEDDGADASKSEETEEDETTDGDESETEEDADKSELTDEEKQKAFNEEQARNRVAAREKQAEVIKKSQDAYIQAAENNHDLAVRQLQVDAYNNKVETNTNKLTTDYERAVKDFNVLRDPNPAVQAEIDAALDAFQAQQTTVDQFGNVYAVRGSLYKVLQSKADSIAKLTGIGARKQVKSKDKEKSKSLTVPTRAPKEAKPDPLMAGFDEEAAKG